jgi:hypothetical protein
MFNVYAYLNELTVTQDDEEVARSKDWTTLTLLILDDPWLARQGFFGMAGAMERQIEYLGGTLRPNTVAKLQRTYVGNINSESDLSQVKWANYDAPHLNDDIPVDDQRASTEAFIEQLDERMRTASILFVECLKQHDGISKELDQLTYSGIKAKAASNKAAMANRQAA